MLFSQCLAYFVAVIILVCAFIFAEQISVVAVLLHDLDDLRIRDRCLFEVIAHVDELGVAAVDVRKERNDIFRPC